MTTGSCQCDGVRCVLVAMHHRAMRALTCELLERECDCHVVTGSVHADEALPDGCSPDVLVVDGADFPERCGRLAADWNAHVVVIGPEPGTDYRGRAMQSGASSWVPRERVGDTLVAEVRSLLGGSTPHARRR